MNKKDNKEKVFVTRNTKDHFVFLWRKPIKGLWEPINISEKENWINWQRSDRSLESIDFYDFLDFQKKYGILIKEGEKRNISLSIRLLNCQDYKIISNDPNRKK